MRALRQLVLLAIFVVPCLALAGKPIEVMTSLNDVFRIADNDQWNIKVERELQLRFTDVSINQKRGYPFSLILYFKADTPDLAQFDTPEKIERSVRLSSEKYLPEIVEKQITLRKVPNISTYGYFTVLTDAKVVQKSTTAAGEFKYLTRGMIRLSKDSAL